LVIGSLDLGFSGVNRPCSSFGFVVGHNGNVTFV